MKNFYLFRRMVLAAVALAAFLLTASTVEAQAFKRGVVIEEITGTWCGHCTLGAWAMDSLEKKYGELAVVIAWHGPLSYSEPLAIADGQGDSVTAAWGITGYPNAIVDRYYVNGFNDSPNKGGRFVGETNVTTDGRKEPTVDFRIVNTTYNEVTKRVEFDIDVTPFNAATMKTEDTTNYVTVAVITEDGIIEDQYNYAPHGGATSNGYIEGFEHENVARAAIGKVLGNKFTLNTVPATWPRRIHYGYFLDAAWNAPKIQVKAFVVAVSPKSKTPQRHEVLDARQTGYVTTMPSTVADMVYVFPLIPSYSNVPTDKPLNIVFGKGGNVNNVKLEYTIDNGATWQTIVASTSQSPYSWTLPADMEGKTVKIRATNASNPATNGLSQPFQMKEKPIGSILIYAPLAGDLLTVGTPTDINFSVNQPVTTNKTIEVSYDDGATWSAITQLTTEVLTYKWTPDSASAAAKIRIKDESLPTPVIGMTGTFAIQKVVAPTPKFKTFTMSGVSSGNLPFNTATTFSWTFQDGSVPGPYNIEMSTDMSDWSETVASNIPEGNTSATWTSPSTGYVPQAYFRITNNTSETGQTMLAFGGNPISIGTQAGVLNHGGMPTAFHLSTNYPNPFGAVTNIDFDVPERSFVTLSVRNELGQEVARLVSGMLDAGSYTADFDASQLATGIYTYTLEAGSTKLTGKMSVVR